jgi:photosystem II stability/assembly factor-like uncharacterized protein
MTAPRELLISTRKGLFVATRTAGAWAISHASFIGDRVTLAMVDPRDRAWYAALDHGHFGVKLHRSEDQGRTWTEIASPAYPPKPEGLDDKDGNGKPIQWTNKGIWALAPALDRPGALWAGTAPGGLFRSDDRGATWKLNEGMWHNPARQRWFGGGADEPMVHSICVDPRDPRKVVIAISCGGVWRSEDAGATWTNRAHGMIARFMPPDRQGDVDIQDPHLVVQCAAAPQVFWSQHHCGIFRSTDDLGSWHELTGAQPSTFGFAVAVHPRDPDTAWFVPAQSDEKRVPVEGQVVVTRTRDGGKRWETLRHGLPDRFAFDLVFRHALAVADDGDTLAFGSTTGGLWTTGDQGDHWTLLSAHLPPIAAVTWS